MIWDFDTSDLIGILTVFIGTIGFSIVMYAPRKYWFLVSVVGTISWMLFLFCSHFINSFYSNLIAAAFCSLSVHFAASKIKTPVTVLLLPAAVPLFPGGSLYYTMFYGLSGEYQLMKQFAFSTFSTIFALAIGFSVISLLYQETIRKTEIISKTVIEHVHHSKKI